MIRWIRQRWAVHKLQRDCRHDWEPLGFVDWECVKCSKLTDGWPDNV